MTETLVSANLRVDAAKIVDYLLSRANSHGKASFFLGFGFHPEAWEVMATSLKKHARTHPLSAVVDSPYRARYSVDGELETPIGRSPKVRTVWIRETGSEELRLITAHPI